MLEVQNADTEELLKYSQLAGLWDKTKEDIVSLFRQFGDHIVGCDWLLQQDIPRKLEVV